MIRPRGVANETALLSVAVSTSQQVSCFAEWVLPFPLSDQLLLLWPVLLTLLKLFIVAPLHRFFFTASHPTPPATTVDMPQLTGDHEKRTSYSYTVNTEE